MSIYSLANRTTATSAASASLEMRTTATDRARLMELGLTQNTATAGVYGLGRPAAIGITPTSPVTVLAEDSGDPAGTVTTALAWGTGPTVPAAFFRRVTCPATAGAGIIWIFPRGLVIAVSNSIVVWIIATAPVCDIWCVVDE
jgi:hypothetical protein